VSNYLSWKEWWRTKKCGIIGGGVAVLATTAAVGGVAGTLL